MTGSLVPQPTDSILDAVKKAVPDEGLARQVIANPSLAASLGAQTTPGGGGEPGGKSETAPTAAPRAITLTALDDIGRATAEDVKEALHQVIDPELGIDVVDLGLVYGIEIDELGRAIITMTLTTPACPLTDLLEDETASVLAGLVEEFRIDWVWTPPWSMDMITPEGREQLNAIGYNF